MLTLSPNDHDMLRGAQGPAKRMVISIVAGMAEVAGAKELLDVTSPHIDRFFLCTCVVAEELHCPPLPLVALSEEDFAQLNTDDTVQITESEIVILYR